MKNKLVLISSFLLLGLLALGAKIVLAQSMVRISTACESRLGVLLAKDNGDGFSMIKSCPKGTREVVLGEKATGGEDPGTTIPNVLFIDGGFFLMKNGVVLEYWDGNWNPVTSLNLPSDLVLTVVSWNNDWFVDKDGHVYRYTSTGYEMVNSPTL